MGDCSGHYPLTEECITTTSTSAPPSVTTTTQPEPPPPVLPDTGWESADLLVAGGAVFAIGALLVAITAERGDLRSLGLLATTLGALVVALGLAMGGAW